jgi:hypothetical protein
MTGFYGLVYVAGVLGLLLLFAARWPMVRLMHTIVFGDSEMVFATVFIVAFFWPALLPALTSKRNL